MAEIPEPQHSIPALIDEWHANNTQKPRPHMGVSMIAHPCERWMWLSFRWAVVPKWDGRMLRLFRRGHNEEPMIVRDLRAIGIDIQNTGARSQARVDFGSHVSGSMDGIIQSGIPQAPHKKHVAEFKTHNKKSFDALMKDGVEKTKPDHYGQMQCYMHGSKIDRALYVAVCKDDDRMYTERVRYDATVAEYLIERAKRIAMSERMPEPLSTDPSWYQCKFCPAHEFCHETKLTKEVNCRTCAFSTPKEDSTWRCERYEADDIPEQHQHEGCDQHVLHFDLVPWEAKDGPKDWTLTFIIDDLEVVNGEADAGVFASSEIIANPSACANLDPMAKKIRAAWPGSKISGKGM